MSLHANVAVPARDRGRLERLCRTSARRARSRRPARAVHNFSASPYRRVDLVAQLPAAADHRAAIALLRERLGAIPHVLAQPQPEVEILELTPTGPRLAVRPYTHTDHYWQVYFDANRVIREALGEAGILAPGQPASAAS